MHSAEHSEVQSILPRIVLLVVFYVINKIEMTMQWMLSDDERVLAAANWHDIREISVKELDYKYRY